MIPYATLEDAAAALGRNLTWFETIWFNYSATKSNVSIYFNTLNSFILVFTIAPLPLVFIELSRSLMPSKIQPKVKHSFFDMLWCYGAVMKMFVLNVSVLQIVLYPAVQMIGLRRGLPLPSLLEIVAQLVVYVLVEDYGSYWTHRMLHSKWCYEKIHHIHHEYESPIGYAAFYSHWGEIVIQGIPTVLGPVIAPGHFVTFWCWILIRELESISNHSGYDFRWSLAKLIPFYGGSEFHDYHHFVGGQSHSNFGTILSYCDYIYGTDKGYRIHKKLLRKSKESRKSRSQPEKKINRVIK